MDGPCGVETGTAECTRITGEDTHGFPGAGIFRREKGSELSGSKERGLGDAGTEREGGVVHEWVSTGSSTRP